jgi:hypothetical protein
METQRIKTAIGAPLAAHFAHYGGAAEEAGVAEPCQSQIPLLLLPRVELREFCIPVGRRRACGRLITDGCHPRQTFDAAGEGASQ